MLGRGVLREQGRRGTPRVQMRQLHFQASFLSFFFPVNQGALQTHGAERGLANTQVSLLPQQAPRGGGPRFRLPKL